MTASDGNVYDTHDLGTASPLTEVTEVVRTSMPLPMFFGAKGLD